MQTPSDGRRCRNCTKFSPAAIIAASGFSTSVAAPVAFSISSNLDCSRLAISTLSFSFEVYIGD
jgi:hypothetical protein